MKMIATENTEVTECSLLTLLTLLTSLTYFHSSLECCRALTRKRMKTDTTDLRSIEAPLAEGEEE